MQPLATFFKYVVLNGQLLNLASTCNLYFRQQGASVLLNPANTLMILINSTAQLFINRVSKYLCSRARFNACFNVGYFHVYLKSKSAAGQVVTQSGLMDYR